MTDRRDHPASPPTDATDDLAPLLVDANEAARLLSISPRKLWELTNRDRVPHMRIGRAVRYPVDGLRAWIRDRVARGRRD